MGALDLYSVDSEPLDDDTIAEVDRGIAGPITSMLFRQPVSHDLNPFTSPSWLANDITNDRMNVWVAIGMLMSALALPNHDALAVLRGYAFSHGRTLDEIARDVTDQQLKPDQLLVQQPPAGCVRDCEYRLSFERLLLATQNALRPHCRAHLDAGRGIRLCHQREAGAEGSVV